MSWNEAYSVWNALRIKRVRNEDYLKGSALYQARMAHESTVPQENFILSLLIRFAPGLPAFFANPFRALGQLFNRMSNPNGPMSTVFQNALRSTRELVLQAFRPVFEIADKLATLLGDACKLLDDVWHHNLEVFKSLLTQSRFLLLLQQVDGLMKQVLRQFAPRRIAKTLTRRLRSMVGRLFGRDEEAEEERFQDLLSA